MIHDHADLPDPLADLERRLAGWTPAPAADPMHRDRLLFAAGAQAGRQQARRQAGAVGLILLVGLGGWAIGEHQERTRLEVALRTEQARAAALVAVAPPPPPGVSPGARELVNPPDPSSVLALARRFARDDFAQLDPTPPPSGPVGSTPTDPAAPILTPRGRSGAVDPLGL